jgi:hypothetical protein
MLDRLPEQDGLDKGFDKLVDGERDRSVAVGTMRLGGDRLR